MTSDPRATKPALREASFRRRTAIREIQQTIDGLLASGVAGENPRRMRRLTERSRSETPGLVDNRARSALLSDDQVKLVARTFRSLDHSSTESSSTSRGPN